MEEAADGHATPALHTVLLTPPTLPFHLDWGSPRSQSPVILIQNLCIQASPVASSGENASQSSPPEMPPTPAPCRLFFMECGGFSLMECWGGSAVKRLHKRGFSWTPHLTHPRPPSHGALTSDA